MATVVIDNTCPQAQNLLNYISTFPFAKVIEENPYLDESEKGYSIEEIREMGYDKLSAHYGVDVRKL